jgi:hypothetical protein
MAEESSSKQCSHATQGVVKSHWASDSGGDQIVLSSEDRHGLVGPNTASDFTIERVVRDVVTFFLEFDGPNFFPDVFFLLVGKVLVPLDLLLFENSATLVHPPDRPVFVVSVILKLQCAVLLRNAELNHESTYFCEGEHAVATSQHVDHIQHIIEGSLELPVKQRVIVFDLKGLARQPHALVVVVVAYLELAHLVGVFSTHLHQVGLDRLAAGGVLAVVPAGVVELRSTLVLGVVGNQGQLIFPYLPRDFALLNKLLEPHHHLVNGVPFFWIFCQHVPQKPACALEGRLLNKFLHGEGLLSTRWLRARDHGVDSLPHN